MDRETKIAIGAVAGFAAIGLIAMAATSTPAPAKAPPGPGGGLKIVPVPPVTIASGDAAFIVVLDTSNLATPDQIVTALTNAGWTASIPPTTSQMVKPPNPFNVSGTAWLVPVVRAGASLTISSLPMPLGGSLYILDGGVNPPSPLPPSA